MTHREDILLDSFIEFVHNQGDDSNNTVDFEYSTYSTVFDSLLPDDEATLATFLTELKNVSHVAIVHKSGRTFETGKRSGKSGKSSGEVTTTLNKMKALLAQHKEFLTRVQERKPNPLPSQPTEQKKDEMLNSMADIYGRCTNLNYECKDSYSTARGSDGTPHVNNSFHGRVPSDRRDKLQDVEPRSSTRARGLTEPSSDARTAHPTCSSDKMSALKYRLANAERSSDPTTNRAREQLMQSLDPIIRLSRRLDSQGSSATRTLDSMSTDPFSCRSSKSGSKTMGIHSHGTRNLNYQKAASAGASTHAGNSTITGAFKVPVADDLKSKFVFRLTLLIDSHY